MGTVPAVALRLRPLRPQDEMAALTAHTALAADPFPFLLDHRPDRPWNEYLQHLDEQRKGHKLAADRVPATFLAASVATELVGRVSVRHELNDELAAYGGHIGYGVVPWQRRRGYATEILRQGLVIARSVGIDSVLVICGDGNVGSARTIEACGGQLEAVVDLPGVDEPQRRYWIE